MFLLRHQNHICRCMSFRSYWPVWLQQENVDYCNVKNISKLDLFEKLRVAKRELISKKLILDKKDKHQYPIVDVPFNIPDNWKWSFFYLIFQLYMKGQASENINIQMISTSEIKISVVVAEKYMELALRALHSEFELQGE